MEPLAALGACSSILQIIDFSCKILSKGNQLRNSLSGALPENAQLERVIAHLYGLVTQLQQHPIGQQGRLKDMVSLCLEMTNELLIALEKLKVHGQKSKWKSWRQAVKSVWKKERIDEVLGRLNVVRDEIEFGVILDLKEDLISLSAQQSIRFDSLDQATRAILQAILDGQSASVAASNVQLRALDDISAKLESLIINEHQQTRNEILGEMRQQNSQAAAGSGHMWSVLHVDPSQLPQTATDVLTMLRFSAIDDRHSAIPDAHRKTFEWIWRDDSNFWQWLTTKQGIYWVSGKAGSGKSTLMKYIYHHERKISGMEQWSHGIEVITAGFFFWNSGSALQRSLRGLLQSLLYEILQQKEDLKEAVFPKDVLEEVSKRWIVRSPDTDSIWTVADLKSAFARLLRLPSLKICLFIDGLDEFEGDEEEVVDLFQGIIASPSVKACLSSRPLVAFESAFSSCVRLRLQDLTHRDINIYVRENLEGREEVLRMGAAEPSEFQQLVNDIIAKSSGVFLWVTLAVRTLLEGLTNYDRMADLRYRLKNIPDDLSQLYWHMLLGIKPAFYLGQAARLLSIVYAAYIEKISINAVDLLFAEDYEPGKPLPEKPGQYNDWYQAQSIFMEGRLKSRCRGLLEVQNGEIVFLHQSVAEFLVQKDVEPWLKENTPANFNPYYALLAAFLVDIRHRGANSDTLVWYVGQPGQDRERILFHLAGKGESLGTADVSLMKEFNEILETTLRSPHEKFTSPRLQCLSTLSLAGLVAYRNHPRPTAWNDTFVSVCLQKGLVSYVSTMLDSGESMRQGIQGRPLLDFMIELDCVVDWVRKREEPRKLIECCRMLLERGADPNEEYRGRTVWEHVIYLADGGYPYTDSTLIENFQRREDGHLIEEYYYPDLSSHSIWIEIMILFLSHGADPNAGLAKAVADGVEEITPISKLVSEFLFKSDWKKRPELHAKLKSLGGTLVSYRRKQKLVPRHLIWDILPEAEPNQIPGAPSTKGMLNDFTPASKKLAKPYPSHEGMIPIWTEPRLSQRSVAPPTPIRTFPQMSVNMARPVPSSNPNHQTIVGSTPVLLQSPSTSHVAPLATHVDLAQPHPKKSIYAQLKKYIKKGQNQDHTGQYGQPPIQQHNSSPYQQVDFIHQPGPSQTNSYPTIRQPFPITTTPNLLSPVPATAPYGNIPLQPSPPPRPLPFPVPVVQYQHPSPYHQPVPTQTPTFINQTYNYPVPGIAYAQPYINTHPNDPHLNPDYVPPAPTRPYSPQTSHYVPNTLHFTSTTPAPYNTNPANDYYYR